MRVYQAIGQALTDSKVETVFGVMGDGNMQHLSDFILNQGGRFIPTVSEGGAVSMADGYFRTTGRVGVASITHGPAVTNALTALVEATRSQSAVVVVTGDTPSQRFHLQELDLRGAANLAGAHYVRVRKPENVVDELAAALGQAEATRRPVLLDIPIDLQTCEIEYRFYQSEPHETSGQRGDAESIDRALGVLLSVRRPIIIAGRGAATPKARGAILELADLLGAPVATTLLARDLFRGHPFDLGIAGTLSTNIAVETFGSADCVLVFGAGLNGFTTADGSLVKGKAVVRCDVDSVRMNRFFRPTVAVVGDAYEVATQMLEQLHDVVTPSTSLRSPELATQLSQFSPSHEFTDTSSERCMDMRMALIQLDERLPRERTVVTDAGRFCRAAWKYLRNSGPNTFLPAINFGSIGLGTATAVGVAIGCPDRLTVAVVGDAGAMMAIAEFSTAVRQHLPLIVVVMNDGALGAEYTKLKGFGIDPTISLMDWPEFSDLGVALGGYGASVRSTADIDRAIEEINAGHVPMILDVKCDPSVDVMSARQD